MKKILFSVFAIFTIATVSAQKKRSTGNDSEVIYQETGSTTTLQSLKGESYLPEAGDWAIGFNANSIFKNLARSFSSSDNSPQGDIYLQEVAFVGKYFTDEKHAYRIIVNLGYGSRTTLNTTTTGIILPITETEEEITQGEFDIKLGLGKEWRRGKTRLQGFYGADVLVGFNTGRDIETVIDTETTLADGSVTSDSSSETEDFGSKITFGINGFIGAEYFILPKLAIGAQYNWGLGIALTGESTRTESAAGLPDLETEISGKNTSFYLGGFNKDGNVGVGTASLNLTLHF